MGSVKDRLALAVIEAAERDGSLRPGQTVVEASSGNTGIGLAMVCAVKGYPLVVVMAESFSVERRRLMRFLGAQVILTPAAEKGTGMAAKARELAEKHGWFLARQFENEANAEAHARTTAREILAAFEGRRLDAFVTGTGTGGTLNGVARVLKAERPEVRVIACEPDNAPILASGIAQARAGRRQPRRLAPDVPPAPDAGLDAGLHPEADARTRSTPATSTGSSASTARARCEGARDLARREGIFCGLSGGATFAAARAVAEDDARGERRPLHGARHRRALPLDAALRRHPRGDDRGRAGDRRLDRRLPHRRPRRGPRRRPRRCASRPRRALAWFEAAIADPGQPVVLFALEWCEFCWALRKFFARLGIPYRSVDLNSVAMQEGDLGGELRAGAAAPDRRADDPAGLRRRHPRRRLHRDLRRPRRRQPRAPARPPRRAARRQSDRHRRPAAEVAAPALREPCRMNSSPSARPPRRTSPPSAR